MGKQKVTQIHVDEIKKLIPDMLSGEKNIKDVCEIVNEVAVKNKLPEISTYTIKRYVMLFLKDDPEKLEKFNYAIKQNMAKNSPNYYIRKNRAEIIDKILKEDLPLIQEGKITLRDTAKKYKISDRFLRDIIESELKKDDAKYREYKSVVKKNSASSPKRRIKANEKRGRIESSQIVKNKEFVFLSTEEKRKQVIYKFLKMKMNEKENASLNDEESVDRRIEEVIEYFKERNKGIDTKSDILEEDVLYMIYRMPTILNYSVKENIEPKIKLLENYEEISYANTSGILKTFPSILGYSIERISKQLKILKENNLIDAIIDKPVRMMESPQLMYALIEFAKERHNTNDLKEVNRSNIFMPNSTIQRLYNTNYDEIKEKYVLPERKELFSEQEIGKSTIDISLDKKEEAKIEVQNAIKNKENSQIK